MTIINSTFFFLVGLLLLKMLYKDEQAKFRGIVLFLLLVFRGLIDFVLVIFTFISSP